MHLLARLQPRSACQTGAKASDQAALSLLEIPGEHLPPSRRSQPHVRRRCRAYLMQGQSAPQPTCRPLGSHAFPQPHTPGKAARLQIPEEIGHQQTRGKAAQLDTPGETPGFEAAHLQTPWRTLASKVAHLQTPGGTPASKVAHLQTPGGTPASKAAHLQTPGGTPASKAAHLQTPEETPGFAKAHL